MLLKNFFYWKSYWRSNVINQKVVLKIALKKFK